MPEMIDEDLRNLRGFLAAMPADATVTIGDFRCDPSEMLSVVDQAIFYRVSHHVREAEQKQAAYAASRRPRVEVPNG